MARIFRRILVPHDLSPQANKALSLAADLAQAHDGKLTVLLAIAPFIPTGAFAAADGGVWIPPDDLVAAELRRLKNQVQKSVRNGVETNCRVVIGDPFQQIMNAAKQVDCIVMATTGRTGLAHLVIGSVAEKVVRHAPVPVLTLRSEARASASQPKPDKPSTAKSRGTPAPGAKSTRS